MKDMLRWIKPLGLTVMSLFGLSCSGKTQLPQNMPHTKDPKFDQTIINTLDFTVPVISVEQLKGDMGTYTILDAREKKEFAISHLPGANWVGYDDFSLDRVKGVSRDNPVLVYCSIGYRSEKVGEQLKAAGFTKVYNLYGSIFAWATRGYPLVNEKGERVNKLHVYNRIWGRWVDGKEIEKVY